MVESVSQQQYRAVFERAEKSRRKASEALAAAKNQQSDLSPLEIAGITALQEEAKIDALHLISHELGDLRAAIESLEDR